LLRGGYPGRLASQAGCPAEDDHEEAAISERDPQIPDTVEGEPVVDVEPATDPLTPDELREAQEREGNDDA
jgi:hypothetical protein